MSIKVITPSELIPIYPVYPWDSSFKFAKSGDFITSPDGITSYASTLSNKITDIKTSKNTVMQLTGLSNFRDILIETGKKSGVLGTYFITLDDDPAPYITSSMISVSGKNDIGLADISNPNLCMFNITIDEAGLYSIRVNAMQFATTITPDLSTTFIAGDDTEDPNDPNLLLYGFDPTSPYQKFEMEPVEDKDGWYQLFFKSIPVTILNKQYIAFSTDGINVEPTRDISELVLNGLVEQNTHVQYKDIYSPDYSSKLASLNVSKGLINNVKMNYLMRASYDNLAMSGDIATLPFDIIPLKNGKTPDGSQTVLPHKELVWEDYPTYDPDIEWAPQGSLSGEDITWYDYITIAGGESGLADATSVTVREYTRLYLGGNQTAGYSNIHLGYNTEYGVIITLYPDTYTYFHMPTITLESSIQDIRLVQVGAIAGASPVYSDRIYKKLGKYKDDIWWGGGDDIKIPNGTWLCSWLQGDKNTSKWMERFYDPGRISYATAMEVTGYGVVNEFIPTDIDVWDVESDMQLTPGAYYKYFHVGRETITNKIIDIYGEGNENIIISYKDFDNHTKVNDDVGNNDGIIINGDSADLKPLSISPQTSNTKAIILNGDSQIKMAPFYKFNTPKTRTTLCWIYKADVTETTESSAIFSSFVNSGEKLEIINHGLYYSSLIPNAVSADDQRFAFVSQNSKSEINKLVQTDFVTTTCAVDLDGRGWICGVTPADPTEDTQIYKVDQSGTLMGNLYLEDIQVDQFLIVDDNYAYLKSNTGSVSSLNLFNMSLSDQISSIGVDDNLYLEVDDDLNVEIKTTTHDIFDSFEDGELWYLDGGDIISDAPDATVIPEVDIDFEDMCCDDYDGYIYGVGMRGSDAVIYSRSRRGLEPINVLPITFKLPLIFDTHKVWIEQSHSGDAYQTIVAWLLPDGTLRKYISTDGVLDLFTDKDLGYNQTPPDTPTIKISDFSGYKLNKIHNKLNGNIPILKYSTILDDGTSKTKNFITTELSNVGENWAYLSYVKGVDYLKLYINSELKAELDTTGDLVTTLDVGYVIGSDILRKNPISTVYSTNHSGFNGGISEFVILNTPLSTSSISAIYDLYYLTDRSLDLPIRTSTRNFIEAIDKEYKYSLPPSKSQFYNIEVAGLTLTDDEKIEYEQVIRKEAADITPSYLRLKDMVWK